MKYRRRHAGQENVGKVCLKNKQARAIVAGACLLVYQDPNGLL